MDCCWEQGRIADNTGIECSPPGNNECTQPFGCYDQLEYFNCSAQRVCGSDGHVRWRKTCGWVQPRYEFGGSCTSEATCCAGEFQCEALASQAEDCNPDLPDCDYEICGNGLDDDCDGTTDEDDSYGECTRDIPC
ncbi:MAG: hypothetical protein IT382_04800, partial [Deltaproteobacteria bacterium]|nr:hypothetical protein [Deltaproteobacteria bacterium]